MRRIGLIAALALIVVPNAFAGATPSNADRARAVSTARRFDRR